MVISSAIPICLSYGQSIHHPINLSMTHQSVTSPISPVICLSDCPSPSDHLYTIFPRPSGCLSSSDHSTTTYTCPSDCLSPPDYPYTDPTSLSACLSLNDHLTTTMPCLTICPSSTMIQHTQDLSQSLAVMNGEQSCQHKKICKAFTNYDLLQHALYVSSIFLSDSRHVAPPKSGEDAPVRCGRCDFGGTTQNYPDWDLSMCYQGYGILGELDQHLMSLETNLEH